MSQAIQTSVYATLPTKFNMVGQALPNDLRLLDDSISAGLKVRLHKYAVARMTEAGFNALTSGWEVEVYTMDGELPPSERTYAVRWKNEKGGHIQVSGIATRKGWPTLDFGFDIGDD